MHSVRRAALRAACSSTKAVAVPRQQVASFAMQISKSSTRPVVSLPLSRHFSQTARVSEQEHDPVIKQAVEAAEETGSTIAKEESIQSSQPESQSAGQGHSIYVSNITFDATDVHLREAFGKYGEVTSVKIGRDGRGLSRGFAFIDFVDKEAADQAVQEGNKSFWNGRRINVDHRKPHSSLEKPRTPGVPTTSVYIGNIPYETSDSDLNRLFRELDNVTDVRVAVDRATGWPRGFAHADFTDVESAKRAHEKLSQTTLGGRALRLDYSNPRNSPRRSS
ncbi:RNA-binding domain-containing protein [Xylariaceae sp. FL0016]|nr:RNA-binding domain-containing protein [Xylariaceae sp. FL0016]